ncbi:RNA polymerase sigma factor [Rothia dentocariosa]|uniref:RNA polymerase sigma factor n=1 Tax=Rothia dentocariosa TaxID=2047 RepID=UPI0001E06B7A|nr:sigma factor [Rothia dentocariosa]EFJ78181.1 Sigma-70 region 2 [Rothia dentocariosa M567]QKI10025.1 sigma-70 family RNA polymerase sigma factor [Rothia dentocariosa]
MKQLATISKDSVHAAGTRVSAAEGENLAESADSQVKSSPVAADEGLVWDEEVLAAWESVRPWIASILAQFHLLADLDDVHQEVFLRLCEGRHKYDSSRGTIGAWVWIIAKSTVFDHLSHRCDMAEELMSVVPENSVSAAVGDVESAAAVLQLLKAAAETTDYFRAVEIALWFDGNAVKAAETWGISARAAQDSRARVHRIGRVIARALLEYEWRQEHGIVGSASVATLAACLPSDAGSLSYLEALAEVGSVAALSIDRLMELTGLSRNLAKKHAARTKKLLSIARSVVETGTITTSECG